VVTPPSVAVIDIGSNSIKVLVAARTGDGSLRTLHWRTIDARISTGISKKNPNLSAEGMARGIAAIQELLAEVARSSPQRVVLAATSAVRDAQNSADFRARVREATGHELRVLTGEEEANFIGRGLTCDPALQHLRDFCVFDLGGGSLEMLAFRDRRIEKATSLKLGCVRLTERFLVFPEQPLTSHHRQEIMQYVLDQLTKAGLDTWSPPNLEAVATGGTISTARAMLAARAGRSFEESDSLISVTQLRNLLASVGGLPLDQRRELPGLPAARADVFPAALATLIVVGNVGRFVGFRHSLFNLRYGLAAEALEQIS
jgi:exopolyphosphatase/guanosine-5'-triphosphate,3'-diphosphate pyrophosphatase